MIELLPCPFCGSNEVELWVNFDETTDKEREVELYSADGEYPEYSMYEVNCDGCNFALGHFMHPSHVVDKWNARIATAEVTPYREALRALGDAVDHISTNCVTLDHTEGMYHAGDVECPVTAKIQAAVAHAKELLEGA